MRQGFGEGMERGFMHMLLVVGNVPVVWEWRRSAGWVCLCVMQHLSLLGVLGCVVVVNVLGSVLAACP